MHGGQRNSLIVVVALVATLVATVGSHTSVCRHRTVTVENGNPTCADLGLLGLKVTTDSPVGTYSLPGIPGSQVEVIARTGPERFDWTSTFGLDAIIVKGRSESHLYRYDNARADDQPSQLHRSATTSTRRSTSSTSATTGETPPTISADTSTVAAPAGSGSTTSR